MHGTTQMEKGVTLMTPRRSAKGGNPMAQKKKKRINHYQLSLDIDQNDHKRTSREEKREGTMP